MHIILCAGGPSVTDLAKQFIQTLQLGKPTSSPGFRGFTSISTSGTGGFFGKNIPDQSDNDVSLVVSKRGSQGSGTDAGQVQL